MEEKVYVPEEIRNHVTAIQIWGVMILKIADPKDMDITWYQFQFLERLKRMVERSRNPQDILEDYLYEGWLRMENNPERIVEVLENYDELMRPTWEMRRYLSKEATWDQILEEWNLEPISEYDEELSEKERRELIETVTLQDYIRLVQLWWNWEALMRKESILSSEE